MNVLVVGAGGVGSAIAAVAQHRSFFEGMTLTDIGDAEVFLDRMRSAGWDYGIVERSCRCRLKTQLS